MEPIKLTTEVKQDLKGVVALMEQNLERVDMERWISIRTKKEATEQYPCGTSGCIAGYICLASGYKDKFIETLSQQTFAGGFKAPLGATAPRATLNGSFVDPGMLAKAMLGLDAGTSLGFLYFADRWPEPFASEYKALEGADAEITPENRKKAGKLTIKRLKHFIKTGL